MSGGHFNFVGFVLREALETIGNDEETKLRFAQLSNILLRLAPILENVEHDLDWDLSGDRRIRNDNQWENKQIHLLRFAVGNEAEMVKKE